MKIIIAGAGQVGTTLAESLHREHDVTLIDLNPQSLKSLNSRLDLKTIQGSASWPHILEQANARHADMIIAVTDNDECNITTCFIAQSLFKIPTKIARIRCHYFEKYQSFFLQQQVIDMVINPAKIITERLVQQIEHPGTQIVLDFGRTGCEIKLASFKVAPHSHLIGRKLFELYHDLDTLDCVIVGLLRTGTMFAPHEDLRVEALDEIYFVSQALNLTTIIKEWTRFSEKFRRIFIIGAGHIGLNLAQQLEDKYQVKLLDCERAQCDYAVGLLNQTIVLCGNASDTDLLLSEQIQETDVFCALTNDDEVNIMSAIIAKRLGAKHTTVLVNRQTYAHYLIETSPDIDIAISPQKITGGSILKYLRTGDLVRAYSLPQSNAEAIEAVAHGQASYSKIVGIPVQAIPFPKGVILAAITRNDQVLHIQDDLIIHENDHLILFITDPSAAKALEKLLQASEHLV